MCTVSGSSVAHTRVWWSRLRRRPRAVLRSSLALTLTHITDTGPIAVEWGRGGRRATLSSDKGMCVRVRRGCGGLTLPSQATPACHTHTHTHTHTRSVLTITDADTQQAHSRAHHMRMACVLATEGAEPRHSTLCGPVCLRRSGACTPLHAGAQCCRDGRRRLAASGKQEAHARSVHCPSSSVSTAAVRAR